MVQLPGPQPVRHYQHIGAGLGNGLRQRAAQTGGDRRPGQPPFQFGHQVDERTPLVIGAGQAGLRSHIPKIVRPRTPESNPPESNP